MSQDEIQNRAAAIRLILLDVDGVLTDGKLYLGRNDEELRAFYVRDGLAIKMAQAAGLRFGIVSGSALALAGIGRSLSSVRFCRLSFSSLL